MKKILSGLIEKTHNICLLLRPPQLDELGLTDSIEALILEYKQLTGINYIYEKPADDLRLAPESSLFLYRLTQEALTNSAKYAQAKNVKISLSQNKNGVEFSYEDDGIGFEPHKVINQLRRRREDKLKLGLLGLKERVELLGGLMQIDSAVGRGTRILVSLSV
jgi:signal transduction histidine kinase